MRQNPFCGPRRGYHHGHLKNALLEAARYLVGQHGPFGFTLAEAAKLAGVTPAAPYRHFPDRNALLGELRSQGFSLFHQRLKEAWDDGRPDALGALMRMGSAYQAFAQEEPGFYAAIFGQTAPSETLKTSDDSLELLKHATAAVLAQFGASPLAAQKLALQIWAFSHGVATLRQAGQLTGEHCTVSAEDLLETAVTALFRDAVQVDLAEKPAVAG